MKLKSMSSWSAFIASVLSIVLPVVLLVVGSTGSADALPIRLHYSDMFPADHPMGRLAHEWAREVAERTAGLVEINIYSGGTLTSPQECFDGVLNGTSDICHTALAYTPDRFPVMAAADLPGYPRVAATSRLTTRVADELYRRFGQDEFSGVEVLYVHAHPPGALISNDEWIRHVDDMKGLIVRGTGLSAAITTILGGAPVSWPATQTYELLEQDLVDATMAPLESLKYNRFADATRHTAIAPELGYVTTFVVVIREDVWVSLPAETQEVIREVSREYQAKAAALWDETSREGYEYALARGHRFTALALDEVTAWSDVVTATLKADYIARLAELGFDGSEVLAARDAVIGSFLSEAMEDGLLSELTAGLESFPGERLVLEHGDVREVIPFARLRAELPTVTMTVENPSYGLEIRRYEGFLLEDVLGYMSLDLGDAVSFTTKDSYEASVSLVELAQAPLVGLLAFREVGGERPWTPVARGDELVDPGPYWLVWGPAPIADEPALSLEELLGLPWPYQTIGIKLVSTEE